MLRVTVEVVPGGREGGARTIGTLLAANVSNLADVSDYIYSYSTDKVDLQLWPDGTVEGHVRSDGAWELVRRILEQRTW